MTKYKYQDFMDELDSGSKYGVFIDDTGSPGLKLESSALHPERKSWTGVVIPPYQMHEVLEQFRGSIEELYRTTGAKEFHFTDIYSGKEDFKNVDLGTRLALFKFMSHIFHSYEFPIFVQTFSPVDLAKLRESGGWQDRVDPFNLTKQEDASLLFLLTRIKKYVEKNREDDTLARVFIDEGYKKNGIAIRIPGWEHVFADGLICFASSSSVYPIQLADFASFCLNREQLIADKERISPLDLELLKILSPMQQNYQNIKIKKFVYVEDENQSYILKK